MQINECHKNVGTFRSLASHPLKTAELEPVAELAQQTSPSLLARLELLDKEAEAVLENELSFV